VADEREENLALEAGDAEEVGPEANESGEDRGHEAPRVQ